ncbi:hypothetical protein, partial [Neisseria meningitidis]|uniref:hypothetical protein n=1 Tax=Neisseria meningitidis TaxID=487 RepID=UPI0013DEA7BB
MNEYSQLIKHPDVSLSPISDGIGVDNPATGEILAYVRKTDSDKGGFAFEVQLSLTEKGQYAVAYGLS